LLLFKSAAKLFSSLPQVLNSASYQLLNKTYLLLDEVSVLIANIIEVAFYFLKEFIFCIACLARALLVF